MESTTPSFSKLNIVTPEEKLESAENCSSLPRADSGQGKSLSSFECNGEANLHKEHSDRADTLNLASEIEDNSQTAKVKDNNHLGYTCEEPSPSRQRSASDTQRDPDSGIVTSPAVKSFSFPEVDHGKNFSHLTPSIKEQDESTNQLLEHFINDVKSHRKELKDSIEGPVSNLTNGDSSKSESAKGKTSDFNAFQVHEHSNQAKKPLGHRSTRKIQKQPYCLDLSSFDNDKPIQELDNKGICRTVSSLASPSTSLQSSPHFCEKNYQQNDHNVSRAETKPLDNGSQNKHPSTLSNKIESHNTACQCTTLQNGHIHQHLGLPLTEHGNSIYYSYLPISPTRMVSRNIMEQLTKELIMAKNRVLESQHANSHPCMQTNCQLGREQHQDKEMVSTDAVERLELQTCLQNLNILQEHADSWKNKFYEKQQELQKKQQELEAKQLALDTAHCELVSLRERCGELESANEKLEKENKWLSQAPDASDRLVNPQLLVALNVRPVSESDETQVKRTHSSN